MACSWSLPGPSHFNVCAAAREAVRETNFGDLAGLGLRVERRVRIQVLSPNQSCTVWGWSPSGRVARAKGVRSGGPTGHALRRYSEEQLSKRQQIRFQELCWSPGQHFPYVSRLAASSLPSGVEQAMNRSTRGSWPPARTTTDNSTKSTRLRSACHTRPWGCCLTEDSGARVTPSPHLTMASWEWMEFAECWASGLKPDWRHAATSSS